MITITDVNNGGYSYWEIIDTTSKQPPEKVEYADKDDRDRSLKQIVKQYEAAGHTSTGWPQGQVGVIYTLS